MDRSITRQALRKICNSGKQVMLSSFDQVTYIASPFTTSEIVEMTLGGECVSQIYSDKFKAHVLQTGSLSKFRRAGEYPIESWREVLLACINSGKCPSHFSWSLTQYRAMIVFTVLFSRSSGSLGRYYMTVLVGIYFGFRSEAFGVIPRYTVCHYR